MQLEWVHCTETQGKERETCIAVNNVDKYMQQIQVNALLSSYLQGTSTLTCMFKADMLRPTMTLNLTMRTLFSSGAHHMPLVLVALVHILFRCTFHQTIVVSLQQLPGVQEKYNNTKQIMRIS